MYQNPMFSSAGILLETSLIPAKSPVTSLAVKKQAPQQEEQHLVHGGDAPAAKKAPAPQADVIYGGERKLARKQSFGGAIAKQYVSFGCQCVIQKIDDINQCIIIDFSVWSYMKQKAKPDGVDEMAKTVLDKLSWIPAYTFYNLTGEKNLVEETVYANEATGDVYLFQNWVITIQEGLELQKFPFDRQIFQVIFQCGNAIYRPFPPGSREGGPPSFPAADDDLTEVFLVVESSMWILHDVVASVETETEASTYKIELKLERRSSYYLWNICLPYFLLGLLSLAAYAIPMVDGNPSDRFGFMMTLILTAVAFKFVTSGLVPKTSYLTLLDKYALLGFFFLVIVLIKDFVLALVIQFSSESFADVNKGDIAFTGFMCLLWLALHVFMLYANHKKTVHVPWGTVVDAQFGDDQQRTRHSDVLELKTEDDKFSGSSQ